MLCELIKIRGKMRVFPDLTFEFCLYVERRIELNVYFPGPEWSHLYEERDSSGSQGTRRCSIFNIAMVSTLVQYFG